PPGIEPYKTITGNSYYMAFVNCNDDAFVNAAKTLEDRIRRAGAQSAAVKDWVAAQDQVFANCSGGPAIPASLGGEATPFAQADRAASSGRTGARTRARTRPERYAGDDPAELRRLPVSLRSI